MAALRNGMFLASCALRWAVILNKGFRHADSVSKDLTMCRQSQSQEMQSQGHTLQRQPLSFTEVLVSQHLSQHSVACRVCKLCGFFSFEVLIVCIYTLNRRIEKLNTVNYKQVMSSPQASSVLQLTCLLTFLNLLCCAALLVTSPI